MEDLNSLPTDSGYPVIEMNKIKEMSINAGKALLDMEIILLEKGIVPLRYIGTVKFLGIKNMLNLRKSSIALVGCGGVGGFVCELLARLGVGTIVLADGDSFSETNLNRQLFSSESLIGVNKAFAARNRVKEINSGVNVISYQDFINLDNACEIFGSCDCIIDAVDNIKARFILLECSKQLGLPLIHGAIGNSLCRVMDIYDDYDVFYRMYSLENEDDTTMGNPVVSVAICAALQVGEVVKLICGVGQPLINKMLQMDWLNNNSMSIDL